LRAARGAGERHGSSAERRRVYRRLGGAAAERADGYGDGRSETLIGRWLREHPDSGVTVATKMGRRMPQEHENYSLEHFRAWTDRSRARSRC